MADFGRWRDEAAGEPAADIAVDTDHPDHANQRDRPDQPDRAERWPSDADRPGLRDLYTDDPDDIFDRNDDPGTASPDQDPPGDPDDEPGNQPPHGEPPPDGPGRNGVDHNRPDGPATDIDSRLTVVDRPPLPAEVDTAYGVDRTLRDGRLVRPPLFDGPPTREQALQGDLNDCGVIAVLGAVAGHRPEAIRDLVSQRPDGGYLVRLHQVEPDERGVFVPTGERIELAVTPELPVRMGHYAAFADTYRSGVSWVAVLEKALAGMDETWSQRHSDVRSGMAGYERLGRGSHANDEAEWLAMLTGQQAAVLRLDDGPDYERDVERWLHDHVDDGNAVIAGTHKGRRPGPLPHALAPLHAYELVGIEDGQVRLHNPWGHQHPEPMNVRDFLDNFHPLIATTLHRETR